MNNEHNFIGIDVSKLTFDVAWPVEKGYRTKRYRYDEAGISAFVVRHAGQQTMRCVMESTGTYHLRLAHALHDAGIEVCVVNPLSAKRFIQSTLSRSKTDRTDACRLADYGRAVDPPLWKPTSAYHTQLQQLLNAQSLYEKQRIALENQLEAVTASVEQSRPVIDSLRESIAYLDDRVAKIQTQIDALVDEHDPGDIDNLTSIPGIGRKTATALVAATKGMSEFSSHRQLSAYLGLAPLTVHSGTSVRGTRRICKMGMGHIRKLLYICSWSAIKCNKACKELYNRLIEKGKAKKLALIAVANKLLKIAFAITKAKTKYNLLQIFPNKKLAF
jgi:transposase